MKRSSITVSELRLHAVEVIQSLQPETPVLIRRHFTVVAMFSLPTEGADGKTTPLSSIREFRKNTSSCLDRVLKGERFTIYRRGKAVALVLPAPEDVAETFERSPRRMRKDLRKTTCSIVFRDLQPAQVRRLLESLEPHTEDLKLAGIEMEFC